MDSSKGEHIFVEDTVDQRPPQLNETICSCRCRCSSCPCSGAAGSDSDQELKPPSSEEGAKNQPKAAASRDVPTVTASPPVDLCAGHCRLRWTENGWKHDTSFRGPEEWPPMLSRFANEAHSGRSRGISPSSSMYTCRNTSRQPSLAPSVTMLTHRSASPREMMRELGKLFDDEQRPACVLPIAAASLGDDELPPRYPLRLEDEDLVDC